MLFFTKYEFSKTKNQDLKKVKKFIKQFLSESQYTLKNYQRSINLKKKNTVFPNYEILILI